MNDIEIRCKLYNNQKGTNLTVDEYERIMIENLKKGESDAVKRNAKNLGTTAKRGKLISKHL